MKKISLMILSFLLGTVLIVNTHAQDFLPDAIQNIFGLLGEDGTGATFFVTSRVQALLLIGLALLVLASVVYAAFAAFKYIRSQGDPGQVEEAGKAVKSIFLGLVVLLFAIVGIVLIFVFFGAEFIGTETYQVCIQAPNSQGCRACSADGSTPAVPLNAAQEGTLPFVAAAPPGGAPPAPPAPNPGSGGLVEDFDTKRFSGNTPNAGLTPVGTATRNQTICSSCEWVYFAISEGRQNPPGNPWTLAYANNNDYDYCTN